MAAPRPNIVLINCDDLGYGDLGCYGSPVNRTPAIDDLAASGIRFSDFAMASPVCSPSRGAMLTGCYPPRIGFGSFDGEQVLFPGMGIGLSPGEATMAGLLRANGYATALVGKWHCGDQRGMLPTDHGFDHYFGVPYSNDMGRQAGADRDFPPLPLMVGDEVVQQQPDQAPLIERYTAHCVQFLRAHRDRPFFLYLAHMQVHAPLYAPDRFLRQSRNGRYGAAVEAIDWSTAVLLHELRALGVLGSTLVVFTSDNGSRGHSGASNAPLRGGKGTTWEGGHRVPCVLAWPDVVAPGQVRHELVTSLDLLPTFVELAGGSVPSSPPIDGVSVVGLLDGSATASPRRTFGYFHHDSLEAVRHGRWKLHLRKGAEVLRELYDVVSDPGETVDRLPEHPEVVATLESVADGLRRELGDRSLGITGRGCRAPGRASAAVPLTRYDPLHPYAVAEYDLADRG